LEASKLPLQQTTTTTIKPYPTDSLGRLNGSIDALGQYQIPIFHNNLAQ